MEFKIGEENTGITRPFDLLQFLKDNTANALGAYSTRRDRSLGLKS